MGWRDVPMPHRIARLDRLANGMTMPYVSEWTSDPPPGPPAVQRQIDLPGFSWFGAVTIERDTQGVGDPIVGKTEPGRQLRAHELSLCNVCGDKIGSKVIHVGGRALVDGAHDLAAQYFTEAPLHRECATYALRVCPGLVTAQRRSSLIVTTIQHADIEYFGTFIDRHERMFNATAQSLDRPAVLIGVAALVSTRGRTIPAAQWLDERTR